MAFDLKSRVLRARAEAAYAIAEVQLESGDVESAASGFAGQARDLSRRQIHPELVRRGWFGVLDAAGFLGRRCPALKEALAGLSHVRAVELDGAEAQYGRYRGLLSTLLSSGAWEETEALARLLTRWFPNDPRPAYVMARACDGAARTGDEDAARRALDGYDIAAAAAAHVGARRQWSSVLGIRKAALLLRYRAAGADGPKRALRAIEDLDRSGVRHLAEPYQWVVAHAWVHSDASIMRLRALDLLESLLSPATKSRVSAILDDYLRSLDWRYYPTEHDRAVSLARATGASARTFAHLEMIAEVHEILGRGRAATVEHLVRLATASEPDGDAARYYEAAIDSVRDGVVVADTKTADRTELAALLGAEPRAPQLAHACLCLRRNPDEDAARRILSQFEGAGAATPHTQASLTLAVPTLLKHWRSWADIRPAMVRAVDRYLELAPAPTFGFSALGDHLAVLDEMELAARAYVRAEAVGEAITERARLHMASHCLKRDQRAEATSWLLALAP